jgi:hypothetical protein
MAAFISHCNFCLRVRKFNTKEEAFSTQCQCGKFDKSSCGNCLSPNESHPIRHSVSHRMMCPISFDTFGCYDPHSDNQEVAQLLISGCRNLDTLYLKSHVNLDGWTPENGLLNMAPSSAPSHQH